MPADAFGPDLARLYRDTRERVVELVSGLDGEALDRQVPACPLWSVRDVLAHLTAVAEDSVAGRLAGVPTEAETAIQVARFRGRPVPEIIALWAEVAAAFERVVGKARVWPALIDVTSHEHDIRTAVDRPGARDSEAVWHTAQELLRWMRPPVLLHVAVEDAEFTLGPEGEPPLGLTTSRFEALRWRMGRRSRAQLAALDWSGDPAPVLDHLAIFGPAGRDIVE